MAMNPEKIYEETAATLLELDLNRPYGYTARRSLAIAMAEKVRSVTGRQEKADKIEDCHARPVIVLEDERRRYETDFHCNYPKLCPFCSKAESNRRVKKFRAAIEQALIEYRIQFFTLTAPSADAGDLESMARMLWDAWGKLRRRQSMKAVVGAIAVMECTANHGDRTWHPHLHVLISVKSRKEADHDWSAIHADWVDLTGGELTNFKVVTKEPYGKKEEMGIGAAGNLLTGEAGSRVQGATMEVLKYMSKLESLLELNDEMFAEWYMTFNTPGGLTRTMRSYGIWYGIGTEETEQDDDENSDEAPKPEEDREVARYRVDWERLPDGKIKATVILIRPNKYASQTLPIDQIVKSILSSTAFKHKNKRKNLAWLAWKWCEETRPDAPDAWVTVFLGWLDWIGVLLTPEFMNWVEKQSWAQAGMPALEVAYLDCARKQVAIA